MHSSKPVSASSTVVCRRRARRALLAVLPALAAGAGLWLAPSPAAATPSCSSKPAVCARIASERKARPQPAPIARTPAPAALAADASRCSSKPIVCARLESMGGARAPRPPVTLASDASRCSSKPAVCARLKPKPKASPVTLARDDLR